MEYWIRQATPVDAAAVNRVCVEAYQEYETAIGRTNWAQLRMILSRAAELSVSGELLLAEDQSGILGVVLYIAPGMAEGIGIPEEWAYIQTLAVSPKSRGRGVGKRLTQECINRAIRDNAEAIALATSEIMTVALPMYERLGFQRQTELEPRYGVKQAQYVLWLKPSA
jgi:ribosomal protein S18 acetylase RimI-like enzyme